MNVALYARVSTDDRGQDVENQVAQLKAFAAGQGWEIVQVYLEQETASGKRRRPVYEQMMADAKEKKFGTLFFWSLDRFSREGVYETMTELRKLDAVGVCWKSHTEQYLDSCGVFKDVVLALLATLAKQERLKISDRTKAGMHRKMRDEGMVPGRRPIEKDEALMKRLRAEGLSLKRVAAATGVSRTTVARITGGLSGRI